MRCASISLCVAAAFLLAGCQEEKEKVSPETAWEQITLFMANEAEANFESLQEDESLRREALLGQAISLLGRQPRMASNLEKSEEILSTLATENGSDEVGVIARFSLGRYYQIHAEDKDNLRAMEYYVNLFNDHPEKLASQLAFANYASLSLLPQVTEDGDFLNKLNELAERGERLTFPSADAMFHAALGYACAYRGMAPDKLAEHFYEAVNLNILDSARSADCLVMAGNAALRANDVEFANQIFSKFVKEHPRDQRAFTVQLLLNEINLGDPDAVMEETTE